MLKVKELRDLSIADLELMCQERRKKQFDLFNEHRKTQKQEKPHLVEQTKKEIARLLTIMREKQLANQ